MNKKKYIIIGLIILIVILSISIIIVICPENTKKEIDDGEFKAMNSDFREDISKSLERKENLDLLDDNVIVAENSYSFFSKYYNKVSAKEVQENWDNFARIVVQKYIGEITSEGDIQEYYNKNSKEIYLETGIEDYKNFETLIKGILNCTEKRKLTLTSLRIGNTVTVENGYTMTTLNAIYKGNILISFNIKVFDEKNIDGVFIVYNY